MPSTVAAASGANWLSVTSSSGATPATLTISIAPGSLSGAAYAGAITVSRSGGPAITIPVSRTTTYSSVLFSPASLLAGRIRSTIVRYYTTLHSCGTA